MTVGPQAMFVVEYPCDQFCRIEIELAGERSDVTLPQLWEKADGLHQRVHDPDATGPPAAEPPIGEPPIAEPPIAEPEAARRPAATLFQSAPGRGADRRR